MTKKLYIGLVALALACMGQAAPPASTVPPTASTATAASPDTTLHRVVESPFGKMPDETPVKLYTLSNAHGMQVRICSYGGTIDGILAPDKNGKLTNVVMCAATLPEMMNGYMQAQTIGRYAGRIAGAKFTVDGRQFNTEANDGENTLHSGSANFGHQVWLGKALEAGEHEGACELTFVSKDGDGGFPGTLTLKVTYTLTDDNALRLDYTATTDKATPINVTNHAFFNLAGALGWGNAATTPAGDHEVWIDADKVLATDGNLIPTGEMTAVKGTPLDFTKPMALNARTAQLAPRGIYDNTFVLNNAGKLAVVARLRDPKSGREMEVRTDQPGLQLFTGAPMAVALETQHFPDSVHQDKFPTVILKPGETFKTTTIYTFSAK